MAAGTLILGLGNLLLSDEGIGVHVAHRLQAELGDSEDPLVVDGGTTGLRLLPMLEDAASVIVIDAMNADEAPGTVMLLTGPEAERWQVEAVTVHDLGLPSLFGVARLRGWSPQRLAVIGVQPASLEVGLSLSPAVEGAVAEVVRLVLDLLAQWREDAAEAAPDHAS